MDTDSSMVKLPDSLQGVNEEDLILIADTVADAVNDSFPQYMQDIFNIPDSRKDVIQTGREIVFDKAFFLTKKRYIIHVIDDEGKKCDKLKIQGVEIKKSDTSTAVKTLLMELVNDILDDKSMECVLDRIRVMKEEFRDRFTPQEIATPISCRTLKKCQDSFKITGSMKGFPYQVRAAMFYNSLCGPKDQLVYSGDKIRLLYITGASSKYIGFPADLEEMPEWWLDDFKIDYNTEWDKAHKKLTNYLTAMGWDNGSRKRAAAEDIFGF